MTTLPMSLDKTHVQNTMFALSQPFKVSHAVCEEALAEQGVTAAQLTQAQETLAASADPALVQ